MPDDTPSSPDSPPPRTTGGNFRWEPPTAAELQALMPGYTIEKLLGRGGMGAVYKGVQTNLDRTVAIKILPPGVEQEDPSFADRFKNEAKLMAKLMNPAVVGVFDFGTTQGGQLYIAMEYVDGTDVAQMIAAQKKLPPDYALAITAHVCDALTAAHELGIVHRDIKPANILINMKGQVKVADFGLAKIEDPASHGITKTGYAMGTPDFVAPEALMLGTAIDGRADIYAVGVMLYQMLTGQIPRGAWQPASVISPGTDPRFDQIITKSMQYDRESRYQSSAELRRALDVILTVPMVRQDAPSAAAIPVSQVAQVPAQRTAAQKPVGKAPQQPKGSPSPGSGTAKQPEADKSVHTPLQAKKSSAGMIYGIAAAIAVIAVLIFMFAGDGKKPEAGKTASSQPPSSSGAAKESTSAKKTLTARLSPSLEPWVNAMSHANLLKIAVKEGSALRMTDASRRLYITLSREIKDGAVRMLFTTDASSIALCDASVRRAGSSYYNLHVEPNFLHVGLGIVENGSGRTLKSVRLPESSQRPQDQPVELELRAVGTTLIARVNGWEAARYEDRTLAEGCLSIRLDPGVLLHAVETLDLSKPVVATSTSSTPRFSPSTEPWVDALTDPAALKLSGTGKLTAQGLEFSGGVSRALFTKLAGPDYAVRVIVQVPDDGKAGAYLYLRHRAQGYYVRLRGTEHDLTIGRYASKFEDFKKFAVERTLKAGDMYELEARVVGNKITAKFDGVTLGSVEDDSLRDGPPSIDSGHLFRAVQYLDLSAPASPTKPVVVAPPPSMPKAEAPMVSPPPPVAKPPALPSELAALDDQFVKLTAERVIAVFDADVAKLNTGYLGGIDRKITEEKAAGHLDGVLALEAEKKLITSQQSMPSAEDDATSTVTPAVLKGLRTIYRDAYAKLATARAANLKALTDPLTLRLQQLEADLTKQDRIPDAKTVRGYREALGSRSGGLQPPSPSPTGSAPPAPAPALGGASSLPITLKDGFTNSLDMKFVPVKDTDVLFCIHEVRYKDYAAYAAEVQGVNGAWKDQTIEGFKLTDRPEDHPVTKVSWEDAQKFCAWLSQKEGKTYRLPTDKEWSFAVGVGRGEKWKSDSTPAMLSGKESAEWPWGDYFPPKPREKAGNYCDVSHDARNGGYLKGYDDGFPTTAPVMSFKPNKLGLYDLGGNVFEWCEDWYDNALKERTLRGASWNHADRGYLLSSGRYHATPGTRASVYGFRCVVDTRSPNTTPKPATPTSPPPTVVPPPDPAPAAKSDFTNSLGMQFVKVAGTQVLFCIHETRYKDYAAYAAEAEGVNSAWKNQSADGFTPTERKEDHPVMNVSWDAAQKFCDWLSKKEGRKYRLPTDREWSIAVGIGRDEKWGKDTTPATVNHVPNEYPWGSKWPPPPGSGNFNDASRQAKAPNAKATQYIEGYDDGFPTTAPVMSFKPNKLGLYDMGGNVSEWCEDWIDSTQKNRVLRGGSWGPNAISGHLLSSYRYPATGGSDLYGFRVVVEMAAP